MTSERQAAANRENAKHSTGPRTSEGKEASSKNATKTGMYASENYAIRRGPFEEDPEERDEFIRRHAKGLAPRDHIEINSAHEIGSLTWKLRRLDRIEASALAANTSNGHDLPTFGVADGLDPITRTREQGALNALEDALSKASKVYTATTRNLDRALKRYEALQERHIDPKDLAKEQIYEPNPDNPYTTPEQDVIQPSCDRTADLQ